MPRPMHPETIPFLIPYVLSLTISLSVAAYAWRQRRVRGALAYSYVAFGRAMWTLGYIFELVASRLATKVFWDKFQWLGGILGLVAFYATVIDFTGIKIRRLRLTWILLLIIPIGFLVLLVTNDLHHLVYPTELRLIPDTPFSVLDYDLTPLVDAISIYGIATYLIFIGILIATYFRSHPLFRQQIAAMTIGALVPVIGWIAILMGIQFTDQRDTTPFTFAIGCLIMAYGLFRYRIFDVTPIARDKLFEEMADPVVVLDNLDRIVDINHAGLRNLRLRSDAVIGQPAEIIYARYPELVQKFRTANRMQSEFTVLTNGVTRYYELSVTPMYNRRSDLIGRIFVAHDITRGKDLENSLRQLTDELEQRVHERTLALAEAYDTTLEGWARALEFRDKETEGHSRRVTEKTLRLARGMGLPEEVLVDIYRGSLLHDIGKMAIPDEILRKQGSLNAAEKLIVREHPAIAYELLKDTPYLQKALEIPYCHHEKWDGSGYPQGLKEEDIPLAARIFAIVDVWDALSYDRPYNKAWSREQIIQYMREESGRQFDPKVVNLFLGMLNRGEI
ncbi:MAG TPA: histidine kinase N-terminal 7TM domain-containing protein [Anaerolineales bacterium]